MSRAGSAPCVYGQDETETLREQLGRDWGILMHNLLYELVDPTMRSKASTQDSGVDLEGTTEGQIGTAKFAWGSRAPAKRGDLRYAVTFRGPINKKTSIAAPFGLDGLANSSTIGFDFVWVNWKPKDSAKISEEIERVQALSALSRSSTEAQSAKSQKARYQQLDAASKALVVEEFMRTEPVGTPFYLGTGGRYGTKTFEFLDGETLAEQKDKNDVWEWSLAGGVLINPIGAVGASFRYQSYDDFAENSALDLCDPTEFANVLDCEEVHIGPPDSLEKRLVDFELRREIVPKWLAVNPRYTYDFEKKNWAFEIPVFFLKKEKTTGKDGPFTGGVSFGWRQETKGSEETTKFSVQLFIGGSFNALVLP
jgi:hypothetical protein